MTEAGQAFYHNAKLTMDHFDRLDKIGRQLTKGIEPKFSIVVSIAFHLPPLLEKIKTIVDQYPQAQFKVFTDALNGVAERIDDEEADLAFGPEIGLNATHERFPIAKVIIINVAAPGYFKQGVKDMISLKILANMLKSSPETVPCILRKLLIILPLIESLGVSMTSAPKRTHFGGARVGRNPGAFDRK